ncbi:MAG TPA: hypothetical protein VFS39_13215 [Nitrospira sp.]|nr:hypothetical protein [Nitrospira sp.]
MLLNDYLEVEDRAIGDSLVRYAIHYQLFGELATLYDALTHGRVLTAADISLPFRLFLLVQTEMVGVASQLLRRRITDAGVLTRRAIEATAAAHQLWKHPELGDSFEGAYPNALHYATIDSWKPAASYSEAFDTRVLLDDRTPPWPSLKLLYEFFAAISSPAGPWTTLPYEVIHGALKLRFIEQDRVTVRLAWESMLDTYSTLLEVYLTMLSPAFDVSQIAMLRVALFRWRSEVEALCRQPHETIDDRSTLTDDHGAGR